MINININNDKKFESVFSALHKHIQLIKTDITQIGQAVKSFAQITTKAFEDVSKNVGNSVNSVKIDLEKIITVAQQGTSSLQKLSASGLSFYDKLTQLSVVIGTSGESLETIEQSARKLSKTFGSDASKNLEIYQSLFSELSPDIAKNSEATYKMGESVNILSKQMGGDTQQATQLLLTSLKEFGTSMHDPIEVTRTMTDMMNIMSASAEKGSAKLPQIKQALEQVTEVAQVTGISFAETNAYIQLLDQSGKKGSEGGKALHNVLTSLTQIGSVSEHTAQRLQQVGVPVHYLTDTSVTLSERLKALQKIQNDTALITEIFGKENASVALTMIGITDKAQAMSHSIVGTNSAFEKSQMIMESVSQKNARFNAFVQDLQISLFDLTAGWIGYAESLSKVIEQISIFNTIFSVSSSAVKNFKKIQKGAHFWIKNLITKITKWTAVTKIMAVTQRVLNAIMRANPIGIIVTAIALLITYVGVAISYFDSFGSTMLVLMGPIGMVISAFEMIRRHWDSIVEAFESDGIIGALSRIGTVLLDVVMHPLQRILGWVAELTDWEWAKAATGSVEEFRQKNELITQNEKSQAKQVPISWEITPIETQTIGTLATAQYPNNPISAKHPNTPKAQNININTLIGNLTIQTHNLKEGKQKIVEQVKEAMLTAVADYSKT